MIMHPKQFGIQFQTSLMPTEVRTSEWLQLYVNTKIVAATLLSIVAKCIATISVKFVVMKLHYHVAL